MPTKNKRTHKQANQKKIHESPQKKILVIDLHIKGQKCKTCMSKSCTRKSSRYCLPDRKVFGHTEMTSTFIHYYSREDPVWMGPWAVVRGDELGWSLEWDRVNRSPVSQQVWHDKDPSLFKGRGDVSMHAWNILKRDEKPFTINQFIYN